MSRDPVGERGGLNLYGFVGNDGVGRWDYLGLANCPVRCGEELIGHLTHSDVGKHFNRKTEDKTPIGAVNNGISIAITFKALSDGNYKKEPCCCDSLRILQIVVKSHDTKSVLFIPRKSGGIDNGGKDTPFYDEAWNWTVDRRPPGMPELPVQDPTLLVADRPYVSDGNLRENGVKSDFTSMFYTFVVCVKDDGADSILLSGLKWGYKRKYIPRRDPVTGENDPADFGEVEIIKPSCTGVRSFPRGRIQDEIEFDESVNYDFRDEWFWNR